MPVWGTLLVSVCTIAITALVNIRIKFSQDETTAARELTRLAATLAKWAGTVSTALLLVLDLLSIEPLTRLAVAKIAAEIATILFVLTSTLISELFKLLKEHLKLISRLTTITSAVAEAASNHRSNRL
jgi:hypothetical protein